MDLVGAKAEQWADALIDFGPYNTVLHFRDPKTTTLDLTGAQPDALSQVLAGRRTSLTALLPGKNEHAAASVRARNIRRKMVELDEEQGVEAGRLARGLFRLSPPTTKGTTPVLALRAPLLLQSVKLEPKTTAETDYTIDLAGEPEVNPVLLYTLNRQYGVDLDVDRTAEELQQLLVEVDDPAEQVKRVFQALTEYAVRHRLTPELEDRVLVGLFSFAIAKVISRLRQTRCLVDDSDTDRKDASKFAGLVTFSRGPHRIG